MKIAVISVVILAIWIQNIESSTVPQIVSKLSQESEFYMQKLSDAKYGIHRKIDNDVWKMNLTANALKKKVDAGPPPCRVFYPQVQYLQSKMRVQFPQCELENELGELENELIEITKTASKTAALCRQQNCQVHLDHLGNKLAEFHEKIERNVEEIKEQSEICVRTNMTYYCELFKIAEEQWGNCVKKI